MSSNPIVNGWYADPEARYYEDAYYIYVTHSLPFREQLNLDVVYSSDLESWQVEKNILDMSTFPHVTHAVWAPTIIEKNNKYFSETGVCGDRTGKTYVYLSENFFGV